MTRRTARVPIWVSDIDQALAMFNELRDQDPYRIDNMDTFSNLLYVKVSLLLDLWFKALKGENQTI